MVLIAVDLSKPHEVLPTLEYWLGRINARTDATFGKLEKRGSKLPEQLRPRSKRVFGAAHEDAKDTGQELTLVHFSAQLEPCLTQ